MKITVKVAAIVTNSKNELLLIREQYRKEDGFKWNLVKGTLDNPQETIDQCVIREIREETGLETSDPVLRGIFQYGDEESLRMLFIFSANTGGSDNLSAEGQLNDENIIDLKWFDADDLAQMTPDDYIAPYVGEAIDMWRSDTDGFRTKIL